MYWVQIGGSTFKRKAPLQQLHSKKGVGLFSQAGLFSRDYGINLVLLTHERDSISTIITVCAAQNSFGL